MKNKIKSTEKAKYIISNYYNAHENEIINDLRGIINILKTFGINHVV